MALFGLLGGKKTSVGLDIGSGIIKLVVIDHSGSEPELAKVATTAVAAAAIVEGEVREPGSVAEAIRGLFSTAGGGVCWGGSAGRGSAGRGWPPTPAPCTVRASRTRLTPCGGWWAW